MDTKTTTETETIETETEAVEETETTHPGLTIQDLPDCLFIVPEVTRRGGQHYGRRDERKVPTRDGSTKLVWTTIKVTDKPEEFADAMKVQNRAKHAFRSLGRRVPGGIVVNKAKRAEVEALVAEWRATCAKFNSSATTCTVSLTAWVHDVSGSNAANLQYIVDDLKDTLTDLEAAMLTLDTDEIRKILGKASGFVELLPETVADRMQAALDAARKKATTISRGEKWVERIQTKLAAELGTEDSDAYAAALDAVQGPLTDEMKIRKKRIEKMIDTRTSVLAQLEVERTRIDTSAIRLARFAIVGGRNAADTETPTADLNAAEAGPRFARMTLEAGDDVSGPQTDEAAEPVNESTEAAPEVAPVNESTEAAPEVAPVNESTEAAPEVAPVNESTEADAPVNESTEPRSGSMLSDAARLRFGRLSA